VEMTITYSRCGTALTPTRVDIARGSWRICPACRERRDIQDRKAQFLPNRERAV
jgi:hypothetical protein